MALGIGHMATKTLHMGDMAAQKVQMGGEWWAENDGRRMMGGEWWAENDGRRMMGREWWAENVEQRMLEPQLGDKI